MLSFWLMSIGMRLAGIGLPGGSPGEMALGHAAEWAVRVPFCLMGVLGIYAVYLVTARFVSRRAGVLAAVVRDGADVQPGRAPGDDRHGVRRADGDGAGAGRAGPVRRRGRAAAATGKGAGRSWPHHALFYGTLALTLLVTVPQLVIDSIQLKVVVPWGGREVRMYGAVAMIPY